MLTQFNCKSNTRCRSRVKTNELFNFRVGKYAIKYPINSKWKWSILRSICPVRRQLKISLSDLLEDFRLRQFLLLRINSQRRGQQRVFLRQYQTRKPWFVLMNSCSQIMQWFIYKRIKRQNNLFSCKEIYEDIAYI